ncbi:MAG: hypothetical protein ACXWM7_06125 [Parachlamydiaceae bacterium]
MTWCLEACRSSMIAWQSSFEALLEKEGDKNLESMREPHTKTLAIVERIRKYSTKFGMQGQVLEKYQAIDLTDLSSKIESSFKKKLSFFEKNKHREVLNPFLFGFSFVFFTTIISSLGVLPFYLSMPLLITAITVSYFAGKRFQPSVQVLTERNVLLAEALIPTKEWLAIAMKDGNTDDQLKEIDSLVNRGGFDLGVQKAANKYSTETKTFNFLSLAFIVLREWLRKK